MKVKQVVVITKLHPNDLRPTTRHIHHQTLRAVIRLLKKMGIKHRVVNRNHLKKIIRADLIITVGGDGTTLAASHYTKGSPIFAINSAPLTSTGFFCLAKPHNFEKYLKAILEGKRKPIRVPRMKVKINSRTLPFLALNEVLFASRLQGDTARYQLHIGSKSEEQKSSGIWIATGAGSTGAILSAGGKKDVPSSKQVQYLVREPFSFPKIHYRLLQGFLKPNQKLTLTTEMHRGMIFIDGSKLNYHIAKGSRITVQGGVQPLKIFL
ncbi:MAG: NAD(+)/NADH kinase [Deltaproteobacteria bacterium]|nr:NAD(+)/NADH kinase [Deltaproteobacteria bacterium]